MSEWQPIDTAPEDGTRVLVVGSDDEIYIGIRKLFFNQSGLYEVFRDEKNAPGHTWSVEPTHWMPLPDPPNALAETFNTAWKAKFDLRGSP